MRVQVDNLDQPFDLNSGARLELGSTAKLRTLVTYLELVAGLYGQLVFQAALPPSNRVPLPRDPISEWAGGLLARHPRATLRETLDSAMQRRYSASPARFFTGGGVHNFRNFDSRFDYSAPTLVEGFRHSSNLVFVRLMQDIVRYHEARLPGSIPSMAADSTLPERQALLERYADTDGRLLIERFYRRHFGKSPAVMLDRLSGGSTSPERFTRVFLAVAPGASAADLAVALERQFPRSFEPGAVEQLYGSVTRSLILTERAELAQVPPLELWVVAWLWLRPQATLQEIQQHAFQSRQEAHGFLFRDSPTVTRAQDRAIRVSREREAFKPILLSWRRLGYPYEDIVPSLGTAIGSSGDRPAALAELVGILLSDGVRRPVIRTEKLHFGPGTPFETLLERELQPGTRVMSTEVAAVARAALADVVESGTAGALRGALRRPDSSEVAIGGKTGTGENQIKFFARGGRLTGVRTLSRTATFVFYLGDRFYGVATAYVDGPAANEFRFTSGLPVRLVNLLLPDLAPLLE